MSDSFPLSASACRFLDGTGELWLIEKGEADLFVVEAESGIRKYLCTIEPGGVLLNAGWPARTVLAVGQPGTVARICLPSGEAALASPVRQWVETLAAATRADLGGEDAASLAGDLERLARFHRAALNSFYEIHDEDLWQRNLQRQERENLHFAASKEASREIAAVLNPMAAMLQTAQPGLFPEETGENYAFAARRVAAALGLSLVQPRDFRSRPPAGFFEAISRLAKVSQIRWRSVALEKNWFRSDAGPIIGLSADEKQAVALLPVKRGYLAHYPDGQIKRVTAKIAAGLSNKAAVLYRPLPEGPLRLADLASFALPGLGADLRRMGILSVLAGILGALAPWFSAQIFDHVIPLADRSQMAIIAIALAAAAFGAALFELVRGRSLLRIETGTELRLQSAIWDRLLKLPIGFFRKYSAGDLAMRADSVSLMHRMVSQVSHTALLGVPVAVFNLAVMFLADWRLALLGLGLILAVALLAVGLATAQLGLLRRKLEISGKRNALAFALLRGVAKLRNTCAENSAYAVWARLFASERRLDYRAGGWTVAAQTLFAVIPLFCMLLVFAFVAGQAGEGHLALTTGAFVAFSSGFGALLAAFLAFGNALLQLLIVAPQYDRMKPILSAEPESPLQQADPGSLQGGIELAQVHFGYRPDMPPVLQDVSLKIAPGQFVALVGPSGSGKSTLLRLLLGFEQPQKGTVFYDGKDLQTLDLRAVRAQVGTVLQNSQVMAGDIFRNIVGESALTLDDAWRAAEAAGLADDIRAMPMGMFTVVSEGAATFSGGQKQRLMIARALARHPRLIFFDEATSALDNRTQAMVSETLARLDATRLVIAHQLSTIAKADRIIVLQNGRVAEDGSYAQLMDAGGQFHQLMKRQLIASKS